MRAAPEPAAGTSPWSTRTAGAPCTATCDRTRGAWGCPKGFRVPPWASSGRSGAPPGAAIFAADLAAYRAAPPDLRSASLVAAATAGYEDRAFFRRPRWVPPLSPSGLIRAVVQNLRGIPQGGSTIPQQLAKLYLRTGRRAGVLDKVEEAMFATWLVRQAAPEEVAGLYLNLSAGTSMGTVRRPGTASTGSR